MSDSLWPHELQHTRLPCPSLSPRVCSNSHLLSQWCHPTILSRRPILLLPCILPASGSFPMSQLFPSGGQSIGASASASVLPIKIQGWFPLGLTGLISLASKGLSRVFSSTTVWNFLVLSLLHCPILTSIHDYWKNNSSDYIDLNWSYVLVNLWAFYSVSLIYCLF